MPTFLHVTMGKPGNPPTKDDLFAVTHLFTKGFISPRRNAEELSNLTGGQIQMKVIEVGEATIVSIYNPMPESSWPLTEAEKADASAQILEAVKEGKEDEVVLVVTPANVGIKVTSMRNQTVIYRND